MATLTEWANFFVAVAGAAAALTGLIFVSVSISLAKILEFPRISILVLESLSLFVAVLAVALLGLVPGQSVQQLGLEVLVIFLALAALLAWLGRRQLRTVPPQFRGQQRRYVAFSYAVLLVLGVAAGCLLAGSAAGCYWLVPAILLAFGKGLLDAWVVLLEVHR